jgi:hypothetical protein
MPHEYTSYLPLAILELVVGLVLVVSTVTAQSPPPQSYSVGLTGVMPGPAPTHAAVITSPTAQQQVSTVPITVSGTCPAQTIVEIYENDIFAGSGICSTSGTFSFNIDLLYGQNTLIAKVYDALNQPGPDSSSVTVNYNILPTQTSPLASLSLTGAQLILNTDAVYRGTWPDQQLSIPINIVGGVPPYAINLEWGDGSNTVTPRSDDTTFDSSHTYKKAGIYQITIQASDAQGHNAFLTVVAIINGQTGAAVQLTSSISTPKSSSDLLLILWPLYAISATVVVSFWLGERREKRLLGKAPLTLHFQNP